MYSEIGAKKVKRIQNNAKSHNKIWTQDAVFAKVVRLCNSRERSLCELAQRLTDDGIPKSLTDEALDRAVNCGIIDERRFAEQFFRSKIFLGWGQKRIINELERHGIDPYIVCGYPEEYFGDEKEVARAINELKRHKSAARNIRDARFRHLVGKGFAIDVVKEAIASIDDEQNECF